VIGATLRRRALRSTAAVTASLALLVTAAPSSAASASRCPSGKVCLFQYGDFQGEMRAFSTSQPHLGTFSDKTSSMINNSPYYVLLAKDRDYAGQDVWLLDPHFEGMGFTSGSSRSWDNTITSVRVTTTFHELIHGVPWLNWYTFPEEKRPAGLPAAAQFGDLNNDGRADLLHRAEDGRLWFLSGIAAASHLTKGKLVGGGWNSMTQLVRHGDYNGNGKEDVFARDRTGVLWFYPGRGDGTFSARTRVGGGWNTMREISAAGDLTGDGRRDLLARDTAGVLWMYPGNGKGAFSTRKKIGGGWNTMNQLAAPGDMTGDGKSDLLARDTARTLWLYPGNAHGTFGARRKLPNTWPADAPVIATGDATGDGHSDIMRPNSSFTDIYRGNGRGAISAPEERMHWDDSPAARVF
jgi:hypothetical protein